MSVTANERKQRDQERWTLDLALDMPDLEPPALLWAVFDHDPVPGFEASLRKMLDDHRGRLAETEDEEAKRIVRNAYLQVHWNGQFREVMGDKVYLLGSAPNRSDSYASNEPDGTNWFATKAVEVNGDLLSWCLRIDVTTGSRSAVRFGRNNVFDLAAGYDRIMADASHED